MGDVVSEPENTNGRTRRPSFDELTVDLDGVRALLESEIRSLRELWTERHNRYDDRLKAHADACNVAILNQKELATASFVSSEKALQKAEAAREKSDKDREELLQKIESVRTDVYNLRESRSENAGRHLQQADARLYSNWFMIGMMLIGALASVALVLSVVSMMKSGG